MSSTGSILLRKLLFNVANNTRRWMSVKLGASSKLDKTVLQKYLNLPVPECTTLADYFWVDGTGTHFRSRTRTLDKQPKCVEDLPAWHVDGSKTNESDCDAEQQDVRLLPVAMYNDPMRRGGAKLVLCESYTMDYKPTKSNTRSKCCDMYTKTMNHQPLFGFCQQYMLMQIDGKPLGWPGGGAQLPSTGAYYCGVGARNSIGREIVEAHARACLYAGVGLSGFNSEQIASKWKFETKPTKGIKAPDDIIVGRYLLQRIAAEFGVDASFNPKGVKKGGSDLHVKFSTSFMAEQNGIEQILAAAEALAKKHKAHMSIYNSRKTKHRGKFKKFTWGMGDRGYSVRIPFDVQSAGCGYLEDRRPAANSDPYAVCTAIMKTTLCSQ
ncbi:glutamine synthetase 1, mitochondrial-like [Atheta coriaria]|uniref:glutamine synthetase 1, mitochondrial-like n=1 Tax=Dalotia coriaria TaxID=877792 RepID=UPI0031F4757E